MIDTETGRSLEVECNLCGARNRVQPLGPDVTVRFECGSCQALNWVLPRQLRPRPSAPRAAVPPPPQLLPKQTRPAPVPVPIRVVAALAQAPVRRMPWSSAAGKLLISLLVIGAVTALGSAGTLASFNAQTTNGSSITTGDIYLGNTVNSGTECLSFGANPTITAANTNTCTGVFGLTSVAAEPGQPNASGNSASVKVTNKGSLNATANSLTPVKGFYLYSPAACANSATGGQPFNGGGDLCSLVQVYIQQYSDASFSSKYKCVYGAAAGASCTGFDNSHTLTNFGTTETSANPLLLTDASGSAANPLNSLSSAYYKIFLFFPVPISAADSYQGVTATLNFTWAITAQ
jgi:predicted ribosomally synthesized peptide with SipW-like signal peptide